MMLSTAEGDTTKPSQRRLACVLCQQRKVKCDRKYPSCAGCIKAGVKCVPATKLPRRRRRVGHKEELLARLHVYEQLLRQNGIEFEPFQEQSIVKHNLPKLGKGSDAEEDEDDDQASETDARSQVPEAKSLWQAMRNEFNGPDDSQAPAEDDIPEADVKDVWNQLYARGDHVLFGYRDTAVDLSTLHPDAGHIFRLWQVYLENVDPLLKITHSPTTQAAFVEAIGNPTKIEPSFEALMFGIYCVAVLSLDEEKCQAMFSTTQLTLMARFQFGCQQALANCGFLPRALRYSVMRNGWSEYRHAQSNLGLQSAMQYMKHAPLESATPTEAIFVVARSSIGNAIRNMESYLEFDIPALKSLARPSKPAPSPVDGDELDRLGSAVELDLLKYCDEGNPLHAMTLWTVRGSLAKLRLMQLFARTSGRSTYNKELHRDATMASAMRMLECDSRIMSSKSSDGFHWMVNTYFPFTAYIHILQHQRREPTCAQAKAAWEGMSRNYEARFGSSNANDGPFLRVSQKMVLQAWGAREALMLRSGEAAAQPRIVSAIKQRVGQLAHEQESLPYESGLNATALPDWPMAGLADGSQDWSEFEAYFPSIEL